MPRERITQPQHIIAENGETLDVYRRNLDIRWSKQGPGYDGRVQAVVSLQIGDLRDILRDAEEKAAAEAAGLHQRRALQEADGLDRSVSNRNETSYTVEEFVQAQVIEIHSDHMKRGETNRLIQMTRTARDGAFGRDQ